MKDEKMTVAIVDDEENIRETISYSLKEEGFIPLPFTDGLSAWEVFKKKLPDIVILDIMMPCMDGLELCRRIRGISETIPLIFLSSKDEEIDKIIGLQMGGDDYLCKPFSMRELITRLKVIIRRINSINMNDCSHKFDDMLTIDELSMDLNKYLATWKNNKLHLTITEFFLLLSLIKFPGHVKTREQLMEDAYSENIFVSDRTIDSHIKRLRKKFLTLDPGFNGIETVYGLGYRFSVE